MDALQDYVDIKVNLNRKRAILEDKKEALGHVQGLIESYTSRTDDDRSIEEYIYEKQQLEFKINEYKRRIKEIKVNVEAIDDILLGYGLKTHQRVIYYRMKGINQRSVAKLTGYSKSRVSEILSDYIINDTEGRNYG